MFAKKGQASNRLSDGYLRVLSPETVNGVIPKQDPRTGQPVYREDHLPLSAQKQLEKKNLKLAPYLRKIIEVVLPGSQEVKLSPKVAAKMTKPVVLSEEETDDFETDDFETSEEVAEEETDDFETVEETEDDFTEPVAAKKKPAKVAKAKAKAK